MIRLPEVLTAGGTAVIEFQLIDEKTGQVSDVELAGATVIASIRKNSTPRTEPELPRRDAHADLDTKVVTLTLNEAETAALGGDPDSPVPLTTFSTMDVLVQSPSSDYYFGPYEFGVRLPETSTTLPGPIPDPTPVPLPQSANRAYWLVDVPLATLGIDGDVALVRVSSLVVRAYTKVAGVWVRDWNFSGGDSVLLASGAVIPDRHPAADPDGTGFIRFIGISGYAPVTDADVDHADPSANMVTRLDQMRGGNRGTSTLGRSNTLPSPSSFGYTIEVYLWFGIEKSAALGLMIAGVSRGRREYPHRGPGRCRAKRYGNPGLSDGWHLHTGSGGRRRLCVGHQERPSGPQHLEPLCGRDSESRADRSRLPQRHRPNERVDSGTDPEYWLG